MADLEYTIRVEKEEDYQQVARVIYAAFERLELSDQTEHLLVARLRKSNNFIPDLSIVAVTGKKIIGHIIFTPIEIESNETTYRSLALAPVSVHPKYQHNGIGAALINAGHQKAIAFGFKSCMLIGHAEYYPKFGYKKASEFKIQFPFPAPDENCMAIELVKNGLLGVNGIIKYPKESFE